MPIVVLALLGLPEVLMKDNALAVGVITVLIGLRACVGAAAEEAPVLERVRTIPLRGTAGRLDHMALDARGDRLFIANLSNNSLDVVDLRAGRLVKQVPGQHKIQGVAYVGDLDRIFVGNGADGVCNVFDGKSYERVGSVKLPGADNVRYDPRTRRVWVGHAEKSLSALDARSLEVKATVELPGPPEAFQIDPGSPRLYVNVLSPSRVAVVDTDRAAVVAVWPLTRAQANYPLAFDREGRRLFVGCRRGPMVVVLDATSGKEVAAVDIPGDTDDLFFDARRKRLYASCGAGKLAVLHQVDPDHYEPLQTLPTAKLARTCFFDPGGGRLFLPVPRQPGRENPELWVYQTRP
jgi:hypothetical protein